MKHNADQFELFPATSPAVGELVRLMSWSGRKQVVDHAKRWKVISPALYYLLTGWDPDPHLDEDGDPYSTALEHDEVPIIAQELRRGWGRHDNAFFSYPHVTTVKRWQIARGY